MWVLIPLAVIVIIALVLDPWLAPEEPTDRERREWLRDRARMMSGRDV
jgi:hypothetical protein